MRKDEERKGLWGQSLGVEKQYYTRGLFYSNKEKVQVKKEFSRMLVKIELNLAKATLINGFFETYLSLTEDEEEELMEKIKQWDKNGAEQC